MTSFIYDILSHKKATKKVSQKRQKKDVVPYGKPCSISLLLWKISQKVELHTDENAYNNDYFIQYLCFYFFTNSEPDNHSDVKVIWVLSWIVIPNQNRNRTKTTPNVTIHITLMIFCNTSSSVGEVFFKRKLLLRIRYQTCQRKLLTNDQIILQKKTKKTKQFGSLHCLNSVEAMFPYRVHLQRIANCEFHRLQDSYPLIG